MQIYRGNKSENGDKSMISASRFKVGLDSSLLTKRSQVTIKTNTNSRMVAVSAPKERYSKGNSVNVSKWKLNINEIRD